MKQYSNQIQGLMSQVHRSITTAVSSGFAEDVDHLLVFEGFTAYLDQRGLFHVDEGAWQWKTLPRDRRLADLEKDLKTAINAVLEYKADMKDIIDFAGDISHDEIEALQTLIDVSTRLHHSSAKKPHASMSELGELAIRHGFAFNIVPTPEVYQTTERGLVKNFSGFSIAMTNMTEQEMSTKILLEFNTQLLKFYKYRFVKQQHESKVFKFAAQKVELGLPLIVICSEYTERGYYRYVDGQHIIEDLKIDFSNQCSFAGRKVDGHLIGKGSFRMSGGELFRGEIISNTLARGEIIDGNMSKLGQFRLKIEGNTGLFTAFGQLESFNKGVKYEDVVIADDGSKEGWLKSGNRKMTGKWNSGVFTGIIEEPQIRLEGCFDTEGIEGRGKIKVRDYCYEGDFKRGVQHGRGTSTRGTQQITGQWQDGKPVSGIMRDGSTRYEGSFGDSCFQGWGKLEKPDLFYEGNFNHGQFEGSGTYRSGGMQIVGTFQDGLPHGYCTLTQEGSTYTGDFWQGKRHGKGKLECSNFTYTGDFDNGDMHGQGEFRTQTWIYTGQLRRGKLEGNGTLVPSGSTYTGSFSNDKFNEHGTITRSNGCQFL